jgi:hypothetical protein
VLRFDDTGIGIDNRHTILLTFHRSINFRIHKYATLPRSIE